MTEQVVPLDLGVVWEPNAPEAVLLADDQGRAALGLRARSDDADQRSVVLRWDGILHTSFGSPNDEAVLHRPLYDKGLRTITWAGIVQNSALVDAMRPMWSRTVVGPGGEPSLRIMPIHYVVVTKESLLEVLAENVDVLRIAERPDRAVAEALHS